MTKSMWVITIGVVLTALCVAPGAQETSNPDEIAFAHATFDCALPSSWYLRRRDEGVSIRSPDDDHGVGAVISIRYMAPDGPESSPESYMSRQTAPLIVPIRGWRIGNVERVVVLGRDAMKLVNETSEFRWPSSRGTPIYKEDDEVFVHEEHIVIPATEGFFLLLFYVPRSQFERYQPLFERVVASFQPKL